MSAHRSVSPMANRWAKREGSILPLCGSMDPDNTRNHRSGPFSSGIGVFDPAKIHRTLTARSQRFHNWAVH